MAYLLDEVRNGIILSHEFSDTNHDTIYENTVLPKIIVENLAQAVLQYLRQACDIRQINVQRVGWFPNSAICGIAIITHDNIANIYVNNKLNECWQRFTIIKELLQLYIDCKAPSQASIYTGSEIVKQITELVEVQERLLKTTPGSPFSNSPFTDQVSTEMQAIAMAIDLIFPKRHKLVTVPVLIEMLTNTEIKPYNVAVVFRMPEYVINAYVAVFSAISEDLARR